MFVGRSLASLTLPWRLTLALLAAAVLAWLYVGTANAAWFTYGGPKTWLPNYDAESNYDAPGTYEWFIDIFQNKNPADWGRVAFIDGSGNWSCSTTSNGTGTSCTLGSWNYQKKAYCKNNSATTYTGYCETDYI
jgi:hypothetical protein